MLTYLKNSKSTFQVNPIDDSWFDLDQFVDHHLLTPLSPVTRLLLTSDGSMTQMLEMLTLSTVSMKIERQEVLKPDKLEPGLVNIDQGQSALAREAWLTDGNRPLIYAHSLLFTQDEKKMPLDFIKDTDKPLGRMLRDEGVKTLRDNCRIGLVKSKKISAYLNLSSEEELWARYYRLTTDMGLTGIIFELFSPKLISSYD